MFKYDFNQTAVYKLKILVNKPGPAGEEGEKHKILVK